MLSNHAADMPDKLSLPAQMHSAETGAAQTIRSHDRRRGVMPALGVTQHAPTTKPGHSRESFSTASLPSNLCWGKIDANGRLRHAHGHASAIHNGRITRGFLHSSAGIRHPEDAVSCSLGDERTSHVLLEPGDAPRLHLRPVRLGAGAGTGCRAVRRRSGRNFSYAGAVYMNTMSFSMISRSPATTQAMREAEASANGKTPAPPTPATQRSASGSPAAPLTISNFKPVPDDFGQRCALGTGTGPVYRCAKAQTVGLAKGNFWTWLGT